MFVNLRRFPRTVEAVQHVVAAIRNRRIDEVGSVCEWPEDLVRAGDWSPAQWFDPELAGAAQKVQGLPGMVPLREIFEIGPPGRSIYDEFERVPDGSADPEQVAVFDSVSSRLRVSLAGKPDAFWRPRPAARRRRRAKPGLVESHLARRGWVLVALRADTHNARIVGTCGSVKCFGSGFVPVLTETREQAKALCVAWNSTPNVLQLLNMRSKKLTYPKWSVVQLESVKVPESLRAAELESAMAGVFDRLGSEPMKSWAGAEADPVRREIDDAVAEAYRISAGVLADWRGRLAREPTVANRTPL